MAMMLCDTGEMRKLINPRFLVRNLGFILYATDARACLSDAYSYALISLYVIVFKTGNLHTIRERDVEHVVPLARERSIDERVATALFRRLAVARLDSIKRDPVFALASFISLKIFIPFGRGVAEKFIYRPFREYLHT